MILEKEVISKLQEETEVRVPYVLGTREDGELVIEDLGEGSGILINGGSGSGKTWLLRSILTSLFIANEPDEVQVTILDAKNTPENRMFARFPHVEKYSEDFEEFTEIIKEFEEERQKRQMFLNEQGFTDIREYNDAVYEGNVEGTVLSKKVMVIDEYTAVNAMGEKYNEDVWEVAKGNLGYILATGRSAGVRVILVTQRVEGLTNMMLSNIGLRVGLKTTLEEDYEALYGEGYGNKGLPEGRGSFLKSSMWDREIELLKSVPVEKDVVEGLLKGLEEGIGM